MRQPQRQLLMVFPSSLGFFLRYKLRWEENPAPGSRAAVGSPPASLHGGGRGGRRLGLSQHPGWRKRGAKQAALGPRRPLGLRGRTAPAPGAFPCQRRVRAGCRREPGAAVLSCLTWPGMWLYFVLPTFAFPEGGNERASVPPIYCASREPHGCRKSRCLLLNLACCYVNLLPALMSPINTPCVSNKLAFLSLELLKADLCQICPWARPGLRRG